MRDLRQNSNSNAAGRPHSAERAAPQVARTIQEAAQLLDSLLTVDFSHVGLNSARFAALRFIGQAPDASCSQRELAVALDQSESSISGLISRMRADGLVYRLRSKQDQRRRQLMLSAKGREMLAECDASYNRQLENVLSRFESDWLDGLASMLDQLIDNLSSAADDQITDQSEEPLRRSA